MLQYVPFSFLSDRGVFPGIFCVPFGYSEQIGKVRAANNDSFGLAAMQDGHIRHGLESVQRKSPCNDQPTLLTAQFAQAYMSAGHFMRAG